MAENTCVQVPPDMKQQQVHAPKKTCGHVPLDMWSQQGRDPQQKIGTFIKGKSSDGR